MSRLARYRFLLFLPIALCCTLATCEMTVHQMTTFPHPLPLAANRSFLFWWVDGAIGMQQHVWLGPPAPIVITDPSTQTSSSRMLSFSSNLFITHSQTEDGLDDRSTVPPTFTPVGVLTDEWYISSGWLYLPLIGLVIYFGRKWLKERKRFLPKHNLCPTCRYDLHAHSPGQTCPECGTPIPAPQRNS